MTAPTQPPDPRVQRIASAMGTWQHTPGDQSHVDLARVLVEELGGREGDGADWHLTCDAARLADPKWCVRPGSLDECMAALIETLAAQQRENAETIKALEGRVETAEAANTELDHARKSAEQSARDLRENNATLRAELDAIKGAQVPYRWTVVVKDRMSFTFTSLGSAQTWANGEGGEVIPLYRHPAPALPAKGDGCEFCLGAKGGVEGNGNRFNGILVCDYCTALLLDAKKSPALPVVGACVMNDKGEVTHRWSDRWLVRDMDVLEVIARKENGTLHKLLLGDKIGAPLPTEGGR